MMAALAGVQPAPTSERARHRLVVAAIKEVAQHLGNTPAVCRSAYVDPRTIESFNRGETIAISAKAERAQIEATVLSLLTPERQSPSKTRVA